MNPTTIITFSVQEDSRLFLPHSAKDDAGYKVSIESEPPVAMGNKMWVGRYAVTRVVTDNTTAILLKSIHFH